MSDLGDLLAEGLDELGLDRTREQLEQLAGLARLLERWAARINLTGHRTAESIVRRLVLDAAALSTVLPAFGSLVDLGAGAGFPGLPLAVLAPGARIVLVEARLRRHHFQRAALRELGLAGVTARLGRIEELAPEPCAVVIAQAVARPTEVLQWMRPWCEPGGLLAIPGGERAPDPFADAAETTDLQVRILDYQVPLEGPRRTLWSGRLRRSAREEL